MSRQALGQSIGEAIRPKPHLVGGGHAAPFLVNPIIQCEFGPCKKYAGVLGFVYIYIFGLLRTTAYSPMSFVRSCQVGDYKALLKPQAMQTVIPKPA